MAQRSGVSQVDFVTSWEKNKGDAKAVAKDLGMTYNAVLGRYNSYAKPRLADDGRTVVRKAIPLTPMAKGARGGKKLAVDELTALINSIRAADEKPVEENAAK